MAKTDMVKITYPGIIEETTLYTEGYRSVAGVDEAGRGALAGPVVAAAVVLPQKKRYPRLNRVRDSKMILAPEREQLYDVVFGQARAVGVGIVSSELIDCMNIYKATRLAMRLAVENLSLRPDYLLIDGMIVPALRYKQKPVIGGDGLCLSIACASIIAKVTRDRIMLELDAQYPLYGLALHKGYSTRKHLECLAAHGPCPVHRTTFGPVKELRRLI